MKLFIKIINLQFILLLITVIFTLLAVGTIVFIMYLDDPTLPSQFVALFSNSQSLEYNQKISLGLTFNSYLVLYTIAQNILFMFFIQPLNLYFVHSLFRFVLKVRSENSIATESSESLIAVKRIIMLGVVALIIGIGSVLLLTIQAF